MVRLAARTTLVVFLAASGGSVLAQEGRAAVLARALEFFRPLDVLPPAEFLQQLRPRPPAPELGFAALGSLPANGEVRLRRDVQRRVAAIVPVLEYHDRERDLTARVFQGGQAFVGLHARSVVLISIEALGLLSANELRAVVAHELGHDYFWEEYERARAAGDLARLRDIELRCDGVAVITLAALGIPADALTWALTKMTRYNESRGGTADAPAHVPLEHRARFIDRVAARVAAAPEDARAARAR
jgi:hypothetical protein